MEINNKSKNRFLLDRVWEKAFDAIEQGLDGNMIDESIQKVMEYVADFTLSDDIQIYRLDKSTNKIYDFALLDKKAPSLLIESYSFLRDGLYNEKKFGEDKNNQITILDIDTNKNRYAIALKNFCYIDDETNEIFFEIVKRTFKILLREREKAEEKRELYHTDSLTKIGNRTYYNEYTDELFKNGPREITYSLLDLFRLKYINDNFGHINGDKYIETVAKFLKDEMEYNDRLFRIGGDEFVVLSNKMSKDRMIEKFKNVNFKLNKEDLGLKLLFPLSVNYGIIEDCDNLDSLYTRADVELRKDKDETYKRLGLNRRR